MPTLDTANTAPAVTEPSSSNPPNDALNQASGGVVALAAVSGACWGASALWLTNVQGDAWLAALTLGALIQCSVLAISLLRVNGAFLKSVVAAGAAGAAASAVLLPLIQLTTHHRPLGAVTAAVAVLLVALLGGFVGARLPLPAVAQRGLSFLPHALLLALVFATPNAASFSWLGFVLAIGLRLAAPHFQRRVPTWLGPSIALGLLLLSLALTCSGGFTPIAAALFA